MGSVHFQPQTAAGRAAAEGVWKRGFSVFVSWPDSIRSPGSLWFGIVSPSPEFRGVTPTVPNLPLTATQRTNEGLSLCIQFIFSENPQDSSYLTDVSRSWESLQSQPSRQSLINLIKADSQSGFRSCSTTRHREKPPREALKNTLRVTLVPWLAYGLLPCTWLVGLRHL